VNRWTVTAEMSAREPVDSADFTTAALAGSRAGGLLDIVIEEEFVGMRSQLKCIDLVGGFVRDPFFDHVRGEDIPFQQVFMVVRQRFECFLQ
jgi:hypothetical protein